MIESYDSTGKKEVMASEGENKVAIENILHKYSYIEKYYKHYITSFMKKQHPLISLIFDESKDLAMLNNYLEKLDSFSDVLRLIKKSKNPRDFFNIMSEFNVASLLIDKVDKIKVIVSKNSSPDFEIEIFRKTLTIEVKRIEDKREKVEKYLLSWDCVPGDDDEKLKKFLKDDLDIGWTENAEIRKSEDGKTLSISKDEKRSEIKLDAIKKIATLKISDGRTFYLNVKKEHGKLNIYIEDKSYTRNVKVKYRFNPNVFSCEWVDQHTIYNSINESIIKKKQYYPNIPHIIMFDCSSAGIEEDEFEDVLYSKKDKDTPLIPNRDTTGKIRSYGHHVDEYDGVFYKKNGEENYSCLSGVAAIFGSYTRPNSSMGPRIVFFRNPNADLSIDEEILSSWGMKICKITEE